MPEAVVSCSELQIRRGGRMLLANPATFNLMAGEVTLLAGPNGVGKSTLCDVISGTMRPAGGRILRRPDRSEIMSLTQGIRLFSSLTVEDCINLARFSTTTIRSSYLHKTRDPEFETLLGQALEVSGLVDKKLTVCSVLSGGERQRVKLAMAFVAPAKLIILDEPLAGLDAFGRSALYPVLRSKISEGASILITSHETVDFKAMDWRVLSPWQS
jgi:ABC-type multidrug transport system ATPase subunit